MAEENFNWLEYYLEIQSKKDIKNSSAFKLLNENNIDTNELTNHEEQSEAGVINLEYKDEKVKEDDLDTQALLRYNQLLNEHPQLETVLLPIRDGLTISRKI